MEAANPIKVLDLITTAQGARRLLRYRVAAVDADQDFVNYLAAPEDTAFTGDFISQGLRFIPFPMERGLGPRAVLRELLAFLRLLSKLQPAIVHAHTSKAGAIARLGCAVWNALHGNNRIYVLYQVHSFYFNALTGVKKKLFLILEILLSRMSDALLFQNEDELAQAKDFGMDKRARLINIGNGVNLREFPLPPVPRPQPDPGTPLPIVCLARVEPKKNHRMLIDAAAQLSEMLGPRAFVIRCIGEIGLPDIPAYAEEKGMADLVRFEGALDRDQVAAALNAGRLSVLCSSAEGKPRALMESMAFGLPCVATDVVGTRDVVTDGLSGFLIPYNDVRAFTAAVARLIQDQTVYDACSRAAQEQALLRFDEGVVVSRLKEIYREKPGYTSVRTRS
jgi:glycosyltransferase involved in cell wall biosynthesis